MIVKYIKNPVMVQQWWIKDTEFLAACKEQAWECIRRLKKESDEKELFRLQGKLEILQQINDLEKDLQEAINALVKSRQTPTGVRESHPGGNYSASENG